jgi:IclR family transcriptional regulator, acetate operon repressor
MSTEPGRKKTRGRPRLASEDKPEMTVKALDRAFDLLKSLSKDDQLTLTELTLETGMAPSTAHRLLTTMQRHGIVAFNETMQHWMVGVETFRIGSSFVRRTNVVQASRAIMRELMEDTGETANLAIADNGDVVFISQVETHEDIRAFFRPGSRGPMHTSGIGKVLLAELRHEEVETILEERGLPSFTPNTITSAAVLFSDLEDTRKRGWSIDDEERNIGMRCLAAPIYNAFGEAIAGISISGPSVRMPDERLVELGPMVKSAAARITTEIGGTTPDREKTAFTP